MTKCSIFSAIGIAALQSCLACSSNDNNAPMAGAGGNAGIADASMGGGNGLAGASSSAAPSDGGGLFTLAAGLSDPEMLNVLEVTSAAEIRQGRIAEGKAQTAPVRAFASKMVGDYTIVGYSAAATANSMGMTPSSSEAASMATRLGDVVTQSMTTMPNGAEFDRKYMDLQIDAHNGMREVVERMLANADTVPVRTLLAGTLEAIQRDLDEAMLTRLTLK